MIKSHVYFDPDLQAYKVGMETEKHLYIFLITKDKDEAHGMTHLINQILGLTK